MYTLVQWVDWIEHDRVFSRSSHKSYLGIQRRLSEGGITRTSGNRDARLVGRRHCGRFARETFRGVISNATRSRSEIPCMIAQKTVPSLWTLIQPGDFGTRSPAPHERAIHVPGQPESPLPAGEDDILPIRCEHAPLVVRLSKVSEHGINEHGIGKQPEFRLRPLTLASGYTAAQLRPLCSVRECGPHPSLFSTVLDMLSARAGVRVYFTFCEIRPRSLARERSSSAPGRPPRFRPYGQSPYFRVLHTALLQVSSVLH